MSEAQRLTRTIYDAFCALIEGGAEHVRPGDIATYMRDRNQPMDAWQIYGEFRILEQMGLVYVDAKSGFWFPVAGQDFESAQAAG